MRICEFFTSSVTSTPTGITVGIAALAVAGVAVVAVATLALGVKFSTSFFTIRPFSPVPFTSVRLIPLSCAIFLAKGEANTRSFALATEVVADVAVSAGLLSALGVAGAEVEAPPAFTAAKTAFTSVPAGPIIANNESTAALSPSFKPIYNKVPE